MPTRKAIRTVYSTNTHPISDSVSPLELKSRRNRHSYVWTEALSGKAFVPAQKLFGTVWTLPYKGAQAVTTRSAKQKLCTCSRLFCTFLCRWLESAKFHGLSRSTWTQNNDFLFLFLNSTLEFIFKKKKWPAFDDLNSLQYTVLKLHLYLLIASVFDGFIQTGH